MRRIERSAITLSSSTASTRPSEDPRTGVRRRHTSGVETCLRSRRAAARTPSCRRASRRDGRADRRACGRRRVAGTHGEHLAKLVVRDRHGERRATRRRVLDAVKPMSKSPRAADWSSDVNATWTNSGAVRAPSRSARRSRRRSPALARDARVCFDERRATLRIPAPPKRRRLLSSTFARRERKRDNDRGRERHEPSPPVAVGA